MSLLFNMLSRFIIAFLPRSKHLNCKAAVTLHNDFGAQSKVSYCFHCLPIYLLWSNGTGGHDLPLLNVEFQASFFALFSYLHLEWNMAKANRVLPRECTGHSKHSSNNTREDSAHGHHQMVNTEVRLIIFFAAEDGEALYSQQKQDQKLTVVQIMNSLLQNSNLNWRK